eukprot:8267794-Prorocentrum_lima.AAC.1
MTSSLVGSEMCIRDRLDSPLDQLLSTEGTAIAHRAWHHAAAEWHRKWTAATRIRAHAAAGNL